MEYLFFIKKKFPILKIYNWIVWSSAIAYSLWKFYVASLYYFYSLEPKDFETGWPIFSKDKDASDVEWTHLKIAFSIYWPWLACHAVLVKIFHLLEPKVLPFFYTSFSTVFLLRVLGITPLFLFYFCISLMICIHCLGNKVLCFVTGCGIIFSLHWGPFVDYKNSLELTETELYLLDVGLSWLIARALSFALDRVENGTYRYFTIVDLLEIFAYCLYLPVLFTGPILMYNHFITQLKGFHARKTEESWLTTLARSMARCAFSFLLLEALLHFLYSSAFQFYPDLVEGLDGWTLCGLGYALTIIFYLKYQVIYRSAVSLAELDFLEFPPPPRCVSRIHLCSLLWRYFDRGLYLWLSKYLYHPLAGSKLCSAQRRMFASAFCFGFVFLWHGMNWAIFMWCLMNFLSVSLERFVLVPFKSSKRRQYTEALVCSPLFMLMCLSSMFFLSNIEVGFIFIKRILFYGFPIPLLPILAVLYSGANVSIDLMNYP